MSSIDRMFRVIVAGGMALVGAAPAVATGCGGSVATTAAGGKDSGTFPHEGATDAAVGPDSFPSETGAGPLDAFPVEGPDVGVVQLDAFPSETAQQIDAFPTEGPNIEAGVLADSGGGGGDAGVADASGLLDVFPGETAAP